MAQPAEDELEALVREHARLVYRVAFSVLRNLHDAEDAVQEVFMRMLRSCHRLRDGSDPAAYLARIAWHVALDARRRQKEISIDTSLNEEGSPARVVAELHASGASLEQIASDRQMMRFVEDASPNYPLSSATLSRWQRSRSFRPPRRRRCWGSPKQLCARACSARATFSGRSWQRFWRDIMPEKHDSERHAQADHLLDRVLARYAGEPLAGLENRTLSRLRAQQEAAAQRFFSWRSLMSYIAAVAAAGATVAASLAIGIHIGQNRANVSWQQRIANSSASNAVGQAGAVNVLPTAAVTAANTSPRIRHAHRGAAAVQPSSRHAAQFPSPAPLTAQERTLARLASTGDPALLSSLAHATHPIDIVPPDNSASESWPGR